MVEGFCVCREGPACTGFEWLERNENTKKKEVGITVRMIYPIFKFLSQANTFLEGGGWAELSSLSDP